MTNRLDLLQQDKKEVLNKAKNMAKEFGISLNEKATKEQLVLWIIENETILYQDNDVRVIKGVIDAL
jgi:predicted ribosome-associated RNA-binding protein Tma20